MTLELVYQATSFAGRLQMVLWRVVGPMIARRFLRNLDELATGG